MRRFPLAAIAGAVVLAVTPAVASAHHHHSRAHHVRNRTEHFGGVTKADSSTTQPTTPTAPTTPNVTVSSLTNGVLTLTLADGSTVSGKVTDDTEVVCSAAASTQTDDGEDNGGGGDWSGDGGGDQGGPGDDNGGGDDQGGGNGQGCGLADLLPNAVVLAAELRFTSAGAEWERIELG